MTPRERFIATLERRALAGRVPHFELVFFLTMEVFGRVHPSHRNYHQWDQMAESERKLHREDIADLHIATAKRFEHDAIFLHPNPNREEEIVHQIRLVREHTGDTYFLMLHGDATFSIPNGKTMSNWCARLVEEPGAVKIAKEIIRTCKNLLLGASWKSLHPYFQTSFNIEGLYAAQMENPCRSCD